MYCLQWFSCSARQTNIRFIVQVKDNLKCRLYFSSSYAVFFLLALTDQFNSKPLSELCELMIPPPMERSVCGGLLHSTDITAVSWWTDAVMRTAVNCNEMRWTDRQHAMHAIARQGMATSV